MLGHLIRLCLASSLGMGCGRLGYDPMGDPSDGGPRTMEDDLATAIIFVEPFDDDDFASRGWYDGATGAISMSEHAPNSLSSFECVFEGGGCLDGSPRRRLFDPPAQSLYMSYWVKYSSDQVGSSEVWFISSLDDAWVGPGDTHLTMSFGQENGYPRLRTYDNEMVDSSCVRLSSGQLLGCGGGAFEDYAFTEARSVNGCNSLVGEMASVSECYQTGGDEFWSERQFVSVDLAFTDSAGPGLKTDWHFIEIYLELNSRSNGVAVPDGVVKYWRDGQPMLSYEQVVLRTGQFSDLELNQVFFEQVGSATGTMWMDDFTLARGLK